MRNLIILRAHPVVASPLDEDRIEIYQDLSMFKICL